MARKRGLFFHPIFTFLSRYQSLLRRQWLSRFPRGLRSPLAVYGGLAMITLMCATMMPVLASGSLVSHTPEKVIAQLPEQTLPDQSEAQQFDQLARDYYNAGQLDDAADAFEQAAIRFQQLGNPERAAKSLVNQAKALQGLGLYNQSIVVLQHALQPSDQSTLLLEDLDPQESDTRLRLQERLKALPPSPTTVFALRSLGDALQVVGDLEQSQSLLEYSLKLAQDLTLSDALAPTYLSLGNLTRTQAINDLRLKNLTIDQAVNQLQLQTKLSPIQYELQRHRTEAAQAFETQTNTALDYYQQVVNTDVRSPLIQAQARLNTVSLYLDRAQWSKAATAIVALYPLLDSLPPSRATIDAHINLAHSLMRLGDERSGFLPGEPLLQAAQLLATAQQQSSQLGVAQTESYVLGSLGKLYTHRKQWVEAKTVTQQALEKINAVSVTNLPLTINDVDLAYRWYRPTRRNFLKIRMIQQKL